VKCVILAGGLGSRLSEETHLKPKPMVEIGGFPILWHIMKIYSAAGINDFVICAGYKSYVIKEYFANYFLHNSDVTFDMKSQNAVQIHNSRTEPWTVTIVDTGDNTMTGGRLKRVAEYIDGPFCFTYGDGVANIDIKALVDYHNSHDKLATVTAVAPPGRFGALSINQDQLVESFYEKPSGDGSLINGGFFVLDPKAIDYVKDGDPTIWERGPMETLATDGQLVAYHLKEFWQPMDTLRDKVQLEGLWESGNAPWKRW